jgi:hypothetical protein
MSDAVQVAIHSVKRGRQSKFTPERIQQIITLVERGKTRDEIAELIGVTTATLQVMCSKLGISLRRRYFDTGVRLLSRTKIRSSTIPLREGETRFSETAKVQSVHSEIIARPNVETEPASQTDNAPSALTIRMHYKGQQRTIDLPLSTEMVQKLALEAEFRGMRMIELLSKTIFHVAEKDLFGLVLDDQQAGPGNLRLVTMPQS